MVSLLFLVFDMLNALGMVYPGFLSLVLKSFVMILFLIVGIIRFSKFFGINLNHLNNEFQANTKILTATFIILSVLIFNWWFMTFFKGMWLANHNNFAPGFTYITNYGITTSLTRYWQDDTCPNNKEPWHVYITLPEDALTGAFINFHLNPESCPNKIWAPLVEICDMEAGIANWAEWTIYSPIQGEYRLPVHEYSQRNVYSVLIKNLNENSSYAFKIVQSGWENSRAQIYYYRNFNTQKITIVNGGDIGNVKSSSMIHQNVVSKFDADLIFVGGDIAYDNGFPEWYRWYDQVLKRLPHQRMDPVNNYIRLIPLIFFNWKPWYGSKLV